MIHTEHEQYKYLAKNSFVVKAVRLLYEAIRNNKRKCCNRHFLGTGNQGFRQPFSTQQGAHPISYTEFKIFHLV